MSSKIGLNICAIIARIKNYKSIINEKKKKYDETAFLAQMERHYFLLIDSLRKYVNMKEGIKKFENSQVN